MHLGKEKVSGSKATSHRRTSRKLFTNQKVKFSKRLTAEVNDLIKKSTSPPRSVKIWINRLAETFSLCLVRVPKSVSKLKSRLSVS